MSNLDQTLNNIIEWIIQINQIYTTMDSYSHSLYINEFKYTKDYLQLWETYLSNKLDLVGIEISEMNDTLWIEGIWFCRCETKQNELNEAMRITMFEKTCPYCSNKRKSGAVKFKLNDIATSLTHDKTPEKLKLSDKTIEIPVNETKPEMTITEQKENVADLLKQLYINELNFNSGKDRLGYLIRYKHITDQLIGYGITIRNKEDKLSNKEKPFREWIIHGIWMCECKYIEGFHFNTEFRNSSCPICNANEIRAASVDLEPFNYFVNGYTLTSAKDDLKAFRINEQLKITELIDKKWKKFYDVERVNLNRKLNKATEHKQWHEACDLEYQLDRLITDNNKINEIIQYINNNVIGK